MECQIIYHVIVLFSLLCNLVEELELLQLEHKDMMYLELGMSLYAFPIGEFQIINHFLYLPSIKKNLRLVSFLIDKN